MQACGYPGKRHGVDRVRVSAHHEDLTPGGGVPEPHGSILAAAGEPFSIRTERDTINDRGMPAQNPNLSAGRSVPSLTVRWVPVAIVRPSGLKAKARVHLFDLGLGAGLSSRGGVPDLSEPSSLHDARVRPSGLKASPRTKYLCPRRVCTSVPMTTFQSLIVRSLLEVARIRPSGLNATRSTLFACPLKVRTSRPVAVSHSLTVWSALADAIRRPSGPKATPSMTWLWPLRSPEIRLTKAIVIIPLEATQVRVFGPLRLNLLDVLVHQVHAALLPLLVSEIHFGDIQAAVGESLSSLACCASDAAFLASRSARRASAVAFRAASLASSLCSLAFSALAWASAAFREARLSPRMARV